MPYERDHHIYCMSKTYWPILYSKLLNKMGQDILDIRYILFCSLKYSYWTVYNNLSFLLQHAALRTTLEVCLSACLCVYVSFFAIYSNLRAAHTSKFVTLCNIFCGCPFKKNEKFSVRGGTSLFGHQVQNILFALIKKSSYNP